MALVSRMVSDLTGAEAAESEFIKLVIRQHPAVQEGNARQLDVLPQEVASLKTAGEVVVLELGSNGDKQQIVMTLAEFRKVCPDKVVEAASGTRGRRPGFSPGPRTPEPEAPAPAKKAVAKKTA